MHLIIDLLFAKLDLRYEEATVSLVSSNASGYDWHSIFPLGAEATPTSGSCGYKIVSFLDNYDFTHMLSC